MVRSGDQMVAHFGLAISLSLNRVTTKTDLILNVACVLVEELLLIQSQQEATREAVAMIQEFALDIHDRQRFPFQAIVEQREDREEAAFALILRPIPHLL